MNALERKAIQMFEKFGFFKIADILNNGGTIGVRCAIRWKDTREICERKIAIATNSNEGKSFDNDFLFQVENTNQFLMLLANLDFISDYIGYCEWEAMVHEYDKNADDYFNSGEDFDIVEVYEVWVEENGEDYE